MDINLKHYQNGVRNYNIAVTTCPMAYGQESTLSQHALDTHHLDRPISTEDKWKKEWMTPEDFQVCSTAALEICRVGQELAARQG